MITIRLISMPGEWEVKVHFLEPASDMIEVLWADKKPSQRQLKELTAHAEKHRRKLFAQWEEIQEQQ